MKRRGFLFLSLLFVFLLTSCQNGRNDEQFNAVIDGDSNNAGAESTRFEMATAPDIMVWGSGNEQGFYEIMLNTDSSLNIMYTDYKTAKQVYLCSKPNCEHNDDTCTSWRPAYKGMVFPVAMENDLALVYCSMDTWSDERVSSKIDIMDLDGTNARVLMTFADNISVSVGAAVDNKSIALQISSAETAEDRSVTVAHSIVLVNKDSGNLTELYSSRAANDEVEKSLFLRGICDTGFIIKTVTTNNYNMDGNAEQVIANMKEATVHEVMLLPYDGGSPKTLLSFKQDQVFEESYGNQLIYFQDDNGVYSLHSIDVTTLNKSTIVSDFADVNIENTIQSRPFGDTFIYGFVDNFVLLNQLESDHYLDNMNIELLYTQYAVDLTTGDFREITLSNYYNISRVPLTILAKFGDSLFVHAVINDTGQENIRLSGIISIEDYIMSNPNYTMIDLTRVLSTPAPK